MNDSHTEEQLQGYLEFQRQLLELIAQCQNRLDRLDQRSNANGQRAELISALLDAFAKHCMRQDARLDVIHEELLALKRRYGLE